MNFYYISLALNALVPNCAFGCGDTYDSIEWYSTNTKTIPTEQEVEEKVAEIIYQDELNLYQKSRKLDYPPIEDQLDKIYHSGIDAWKVDIKAVKDKYPKQTVDTTELKKRKDAAVFEMQKKNYKVAVARLAQHELANGKKDVVGTEKVWDATTNSYKLMDILDYVIQPLPLWVDGERNPLVVQDEAERVAAQTLINNTPQAVIDSINT